MSAFIMELRKTGNPSLLDKSCDYLLVELHILCSLYVQRKLKEIHSILKVIEAII
jgi:hypothetical protein